MVKGHVVGDFPGSPIDLRYVFVLADAKIAELVETKPAQATRQSSGAALDELFAAAETLSHLGNVPGKRLVVLTNGAGTGMLAKRKVLMRRFLRACS